MVDAPSRPESRLVQLYGGRLKDWADEICARPGLIVAIARKGPRLIELLVREGLLPASILERVVSECALPLLGDLTDDLILTDDAVAYGSTFSRLHSLASDLVQHRGGRGKVVGLPFAVGAGVSKEYVPLIEKHFLALNLDQVAAFVNNEVMSFRVLAKPIGLDHPILRFAGDFTPERVRGALAVVAERFGGRLIPHATSIPSADGRVDCHSWTVLLDSRGLPLIGGVDFCKLRVYLGQDRRTLNVVAMAPFAFDHVTLGRLADFLPGPLGRLWETVADGVRDLTAPRLAKASQYTLTAWANYLGAVAFLPRALDALAEEFRQAGSGATWDGPGRTDLRFLAGPGLAERFELVLGDYLRAGGGGAPAARACPATDLGRFEERIPRPFRESYARELDSLLGRATDVGDAIRAVFYAQHRAIEIPSRNAGNDVHERLEFGLTFEQLLRVVSRAVPAPDVVAVHSTLDRLIDEGCVVPRYINVAGADGPVWARTFRVGEGPVPKVAQTVRLLFERLADRLEQPALPAELLEKFVVLATAVASDYKDLAPLRMPELDKGFHLYGARAVVATGHGRPFLLDWAVDHKVLERERGSAGLYALHPSAEAVYPKDECPWDEDVKDGVSDLARFTRILHATDGLKDNALVTLTSLATARETHRAISTELNLWLHHPKFSVYDGVRALAELVPGAAAGPAPAARLVDANQVLEHLANYPAQVWKKSDLARDRGATYQSIDAATAGDELARRVWRKLRETLRGREQSEGTGSGLPQILATVRIAQRATSVMRDLLALAGFKHPRHRPQPVEDSVRSLRDLFLVPTQVDRVTYTLFTEKDGRRGVEGMLVDAGRGLPCDFPTAFAAIRPVLLEVAARCEDALRLYGPEEHHAAPQVLQPPKYLVMWDIRGSTERENPADLEPLKERANRRIAGTLGDRVLDFRPESRDDGNGLICSTFSDVAAVFQVLTDVYGSTPFRAGCEVNLQGTLHYYAESKALGGRAFEHAARVAAVFKEIKANPAAWVGAPPPAEPAGSYLMVGEFARRYAMKNREWPPAQFDVDEPAGQFEARVHAALPICLTVLLPKDRTRS